MKIQELDTPALVVDRGRLEANLKAMAGYCDKQGIGLRPHVKTHKSPVLARMQLELGAIGVTVAKVGEAEVMADRGIEDILIAYPVVGRSKVQRAAALLEKGTKLSVGLDHVDVARALSEVMAEQRLELSVLVEFDIGMGRCGVTEPEALRQLVGHVSDLPGLRWAGLMYYPGPYCLEPRGAEAEAAWVGSEVARFLAPLEAAGRVPDTVSGGSTPSAFFSHLMTPPPTEIRPGTYAFYDRNGLSVGAATIDDCAASVLCTVVSLSGKNHAVLDAGSKALSGDACVGGRPGFGCLLGHPDTVLTRLSEEHGELDTSGLPEPLRIGQKVRVVPNHICPCVNLHEVMYLCAGDEVLDTIPVAARGRFR